MSGPKRYVLDANVFIEAQKHYYAFDICPGFWRAVVRQHQSRRVCSIEQIRDELVNEALKRWVRDETPEGFFKGTADKEVINVFAQMMNWVQGEPQFLQQAKADFARAADGWLVAFAHVNGLKVVTHEEFAPGAKSTVPISNVCLEFKVDYCNTFAMLRDLSEQFVLKTRQRKR